MKTNNQLAESLDPEPEPHLIRAESAPPPSTEVGRYEQLDGGVGREINFRPPRYPSAELGPIGAAVEVLFAGTVYRCELHDVSQNGIAFEWQGPRLGVGDVIAELTVNFDHHEAYRGEVRVGSVRKLGDKEIVGASFLDTLMNVDDVLQLRDVKSWSSRGPSLALCDRPWRVDGHERFKCLVAEFRLLLQDAQQQLDELEASLPWHVVHGDQDSPARTALVERVRAEVAEQIIAASDAINASLAGATAADRQALKEYSLRHLHSTLMQAPWMRRALGKPLGYPGDYELMNGLYGNHFSGSTLFAKGLNLGFVSTMAGAAVRERKNLMKRRLSALFDANLERRSPLRILSIAAGPAQETYELLLEREALPPQVEIVLFDQDKRALSFSYSRLKRLPKWGAQVRLVYLHDSIKRLLRDATLFSVFGQFDAIFSCGLFDYLQPRTAAHLSRGLYDNLAPGGTLYIGNMTPDNPSRWFMDFHLDWSLIYRERAEMMDFAQAGAPQARVAIVEEQTGINPFVTLTKD
jgi:SAM-dependent methyltransferase